MSGLILETTNIRDKYIDGIATLENIQDEAFTSLSELASPVYYKTNLPSFSKREPLSLKFGNNNNDSLSTMTTRDNRAYRTTQLKIVIEQWRQKLNDFQNKFDSRNDQLSIAISSHKYQEFMNCINECKEQSSFPMLTPPALDILQSTLDRTNHSRNKIVSTRLESALKLFQRIIDKGRGMAQQQWLMTESTCDTHQVIIDCLLKMFYRDIYTLSVSLKNFYDDRLSVEAKKFKLYMSHEKSIALKYQTDSYRDMMKSVNAQCQLFREMISSLDGELDVLPLKEKNKMKLRLSLLHSKLSGTVAEATSYYEASRSVILPQSLSTYFCMTIRRWLNEYQTILIDSLVIALVHGDSIGDTETKTNTQTKEMKNSNLRKCNLYNYAKQMDQSRLADLATTTTAGSGSAGGGGKEVKIDLMNDILVGFTQFHFNSNQKNLSQLKISIEKMEKEYNHLKQQFKQMKSVQQTLLIPGGQNPNQNNRYNKILSTPLSQKQKTSVNGLPTIKNIVNLRDLNQNQNQQRKKYETNPHTIKDLLQLDRDAKTSESRLQTLYDTLFVVHGPQYTKMENENKQLTRIAEFLKQYSLMMREWEEKIKREHIFLRQWKDLKLEQTNYLSTKFMEWNHFVTDEVDCFQSAIGIYSVTLLSQIRDNTNDFMTQAMKVWKSRNDECDNEMLLITALYNDIKSEDLGASDDLIRLQGQMEQWTNSMTELYHVYFDHRFNCVISSYTSSLEELLSKFSEDSELAQLLNLLDNMYDTDEEVLEEQELKRFNFQKNKIKI